MKKLTALLLALLMITSCMVFTTGAEDATTATETETTMKIVPMSDCDSLQNMSANGLKNLTPLAVDSEIFSQGTGSVGYTLNGISTATGGISIQWQNAASPIDISEMKYLRFDLYLENAVGMANATFDMEIRDVNHLTAVDTNGDGKVDTEYEAGRALHLPQVIKGEIKDGWNTVEIPLDSLINWHLCDKTQVAYFRIFQTNPGKNVLASGEVQWGNIANHIGTEGKNTEIRYDNIYFASEATTEAPNDYHRISNNCSKNRFTGSTWEALVIGFPAAIDARNYDTVLFDVYVDDLSLAGVSLNMELCSGGNCDKEEASYAIHLGTLAERNGVELKLGWNRLEVPISWFTTSARFQYRHNDTSKDIIYGPCDMSALDFFRLYVTAGTYKVDDDGDGKTGVELDAETGLPENEFAHHLGFALPGLVTRNKDIVVISLRPLKMWQVSALRAAFLTLTATASRNGCSSTIRQPVRKNMTMLQLPDN